MGVRKAAPSPLRHDYARTSLLSALRAHKNGNESPPALVKSVEPLCTYALLLACCSLSLDIRVNIDAIRRPIAGRPLSATVG
ncbi:MAG: hypothetical protein ACI82G_001560 [Bradymonadia bacterium]|jgi:hypothetical protein